MIQIYVVLDSVFIFLLNTGIFNQTEIANRLLCPTFSDVFLNGSHSVSISCITLALCYDYGTGLGIYGSRQTESEGDMFVYIALNLWQPVLYIALDCPDHGVRKHIVLHNSL